MTRDQFITEVILKECWHKWPMITQELEAKKSLCCKCGLPAYNSIYFERNNDFSTWEGFGKLWEFSTKQEWWEDFLTRFTIYGNLDNTLEQAIRVLLPMINPDTFADAITKFHGWRE